MTRLSRLVAILTLLQSRRMVTAAFLAERFECSIRTIYRDVRSLESAGVPVHTIEGKGYTLVDGYTLPPVMFTEEEAQALLTAHLLVSRNRDQSLVHHLDQAITKIN
ncbi:MAG: HTH domain-containing protein, partial [Saprospiraceae bacterium]|nr:HTH domain-containing protein [Saprospiraceae bacterium]